jgi:Flp pilus assembly protein TadG
MRATTEFCSRNPSSGTSGTRAATMAENSSSLGRAVEPRFAAGGSSCDRKGAADAGRSALSDETNARKPVRNFGLLRRALQCRREGIEGRPGLLTRFLHSRAGVTMVEFALVGPLFLLLTFAIVDNGLVLFTQTILDNATREAARAIRIGKVQLSGDATGNGLFKTTLCNNLGGFIPCASLQWRVQSVSSAGSFSSLSSAVTTDSSGHMVTTGFAPGTPQSFVLVQVGYTQPYIMPFLSQVAGATGNLLLVSTVAFQNEHYQ